MAWYKQHSSFAENPFNKPVIDRCINCGDQAETGYYTDEFEYWLEIVKYSFFKDK